MEFFKRLLRSEKGNAILFVSLAFTGLVAMTGLVIDGGQLYMTKSDLQKVANATVLSGAQELTRNEEVVQKIVDDILIYHDEHSSLKELDIKMNDRLSVTLEKPVSIAFSRLFGIETVNVSADATARIGVLGRATGAAPLGIDESLEIEYGPSHPYTLKVDETGVVAGNFGILALDKPGAREYKEALLYGFQEEIKIGDIINTQTGNVAGPTKDAVKTLVDSCSDPNDRNCRRVLQILVYQPYEHTANQMKKIKVTGFAYFYVTDQFNDRDKTINGYFIQRTDTGFEDDRAVNRGAYSVRLTE